jgi:hypothetical protein
MRTVSAVADAMVRVVDAPWGKRPSRVNVDPERVGWELVNAVSNRILAGLLRPAGLGHLLIPRASAYQSHRAEQRWRYLNQELR